MSDTPAIDERFAALYRELHRIAHRQLRGGSSTPTLATTVVLHEAYLKLAALDPSWQDHNHFVALAARVMRQVVIDHARAGRAQKRGGDARSLVPADDAATAAPLPLVDLLAIDGALRVLETVDARLAQLVELRFFAGLTHGEIAAGMGVSERTVEREWRKARAFLIRELTPASP